MSQAEFINSAGESNQLPLVEGERSVQAQHQPNQVGAETAPEYRAGIEQDIELELEQRSQGATNLTGAIADLDLPTTSAEELLEAAESEQFEAEPENPENLAVAEATASVTELSPVKKSNLMEATEPTSNNNLEPNLLPDLLPDLESDAAEITVGDELSFAQLQALLAQTQEKLSLSEQLIDRQETLNQSLQVRVEQLEQVLQQKEIEVTQVNYDRQELRSRLKRQEHHNSQLKAALERCLDSPVSLTDSNHGKGDLAASHPGDQDEQSLTNIATPISTPAMAKMKQADRAEPAELIAVESDDQLEAIESALESLSESIVETIARVNNYSDPSLVTESNSPQSADLAALENEIINPFVAAIDDLVQVPADPAPGVAPAIEQQASINQAIDYAIARAVSHHSASNAAAQIDAVMPNPELEIDPAALPTVNKPQPLQPTAHYNQSSYNYAGIVAVPRVAAPKFIQDLASTQASSVEATPAISGTIKRGDRKSIPSLAAVKLPQFPPLSQ
jgi:hypothetical protein